MTELEDLAKIGATTADKLRDKGFEYAEDLPKDETTLSSIGLTDSQVESVLAFHGFNTLAAAEVVVIEPVEAVEPEAESSDIKEISFKIQSGPHKNRVFSWKDGNPSGRFGDGLYVSLSLIGLNARTEQPDAGYTHFNFSFGSTVGLAILKTEEFEYFKGEVIKKSHTLLKAPRVG